jgi:hypothetical protein
MPSQNNFLFEGISTFDVARQIHDNAMAQLKANDENTILQTPVDDLVGDLVAAYALDFPTLRDENTWVSDNEVTTEVPLRDYDIYMDQYGGRRTITSHLVHFYVPFDGDKNLFKLAPSNRTWPGPGASIRGQELVITIATNNKTDEQLRQEYLQRIQSIKQHLSTLKSDLRELPSQIEAAARPYIEQRKAQLLQSKNLVASLGFPMKRRTDAPMTYRAPEIKRKFAPTKPQTVAPFKPEPTLDEAEYQHILNVMDNMTKVIERSPHAFRSMGEEDIRHQFLVQLNGQYDGQATGETFNFQGKTDILIRSEGRNVFIAECKFWHGAKGFLDTVDQLLSYLSWRDSKAAVVVFNKNKNLSSVLSSIKESMEKHPHRKRGPKVEGETRFRYVMGNPGDHNREITMTVLVYDIPAPANPT